LRLATLGAKENVTQLGVPLPFYTPHDSTSLAGVARGDAKLPKAAASLRTERRMMYQKEDLGETDWFNQGEVGAKLGESRRVAEMPTSKTKVVMLVLVLVSVAIGALAVFFFDRAK
jgi:hypothetical protein